MSKLTVRAKYEVCERCGVKYPLPRDVYHPPDQCTPEVVLEWVEPDEVPPDTLPDQQYVLGCPSCGKVCVLPVPETIWVTRPGDTVREAQDASARRSAVRYLELAEEGLIDHWKEDHG